MSLNSVMHKRAGTWLKHAKFLASVQAATGSTEKDDKLAIQALVNAESEGETVDAAARQWRRDAGEAAYEEQEAKQGELAAAAMRA